MADTYFGIGKLNFFVFLIVYFMIVGVVASVFNPTIAGVSPDMTEQSLEQGADKWTSVDVERAENDKNTPLGKSPPDFNLWNAFGTVANICKTAFLVFWAGLTFNIPGVPTLLRMFMVVPVVIVFVVVIFDTLIDVLKAVFKIPAAG